jgi:hypothetical protein
MANIANPSELNPTAPGYKNPLTGAINPGYLGSSVPSVPPVPFRTAPFESAPFGSAPFRPVPDPAYASATAYSATTTYAKGQAVTFGGQRYVSLRDLNVANTPDVSPAQWLISPADELATGSVEDLWAQVGKQIADMKKKDAEIETTLHQLAAKTNQFFHS